MTLCQTFQTLASETWNMLDQASAIDHQLLEETVTDLLCLHLKSRHATEVITKNFTKADEGTIGADWEWWFTAKPSLSSWLGVRIQAKILDYATQRFKHLHYRSKQRGYQSDRLLAHARTQHVIPLYCLYVHWRASPPIAWPCASYPPHPESFGCSLVSLDAVLRLRAASHSDDRASVMKSAHPWHCLVCCQGYGVGELPARAWAYLKATILQNPGDLGDIEGFGPRESPPQYVLALIRGELAEQPDADLRALTVFAEGGAG